VGRVGIDDREIAIGEMPKKGRIRLNAATDDQRGYDSPSDRWVDVRLAQQRYENEMCDRAKEAGGSESGGPRVEPDLISLHVITQSSMASRGRPLLSHSLSPLLLPPSMSRRSATMLPPPPPVDRDVIMGPPPVPPHQPFTPSSVQNSKDPREFSEKYYKLKRKYWELEEVRFSRILPVLSPSFLIVLLITNRNIKTSRMSSDAQASEILVGILKRGM
jgi:hypothetical protein